MSKRMALLPLTTLTAIALGLALLSGCSESQPVDAPFTRTTVNLTPRFLPSPPSGMIYELWVQKLDGSSQSIARFNWDQDLYIMRDESGARIDPMSFELGFSILNWDFISISVEDAAVASPVAPTSVMLRDTVRAPAEEEFLVMRFPIDFSVGTFGFVSLETPTDGNFGDDGSGVWFAIYSTGSIRTQDTTDVNVTSFTQLTRDTVNDTSTLDTLGIDSVVSVTYNRYSRFNLDTFAINTVRTFFHAVPINNSGVDDTVIFGGPTNDRDTIIYGSGMNFFPDLTYDTVQSISRSIHQFQNGFSDFPSLAGSGWHYKGWILGPGNGAGQASFRRMNFADNKEFNWQEEGRLIFSTGIFLDSIVDSSTISSVDTISFGGDSIQVQTLRNYTGEIGYHSVGSEPNPWASVARAAIPPFPGEDFILTGSISDLNTALGVTGGPADPYEFTETVSDTAIIFISVEPDTYMDSTANFPLILLARDIDISKGAGGPYKNIRLVNQSGISYPFPNANKSWPHVVVEHLLR